VFRFGNPPASPSTLRRFSKSGTPSANGWREIPPATGTPPPRVAHAKKKGVLIRRTLTTMPALRHWLALDGILTAGDCEPGFAMLVKIYGAERAGEARYSPAQCMEARKAGISNHVWTLEEIVGLLI